MKNIFEKIVKDELEPSDLTTLFKQMEREFNVYFPEHSLAGEERAEIFSRILNKDSLKENFNVDPKELLKSVKYSYDSKFTPQENESKIRDKYVELESLKKQLIIAIENFLDNSKEKKKSEKPKNPQEIKRSQGLDSVANNLVFVMKNSSSSAPSSDEDIVLPTQLNINIDKYYVDRFFSNSSQKTIKKPETLQRPTEISEIPRSSAFIFSDIKNKSTDNCLISADIFEDMHKIINKLPREFENSYRNLLNETDRLQRLTDNIIPYKSIYNYMGFVNLTDKLTEMKKSIEEIKQTLKSDKLDRVLGKLEEIIFDMNLKFTDEADSDTKRNPMTK